METSSQVDLADKDKINYVAALFHHVDIVFSIISIVIFFDYDQIAIAGIALTLLLIERIYLFFFTGVKTYKWSQALMAVVFLDYIGQMCKAEEGRGMRLFKLKYIRVLLVSSPFAMFNFFTFYSDDSTTGLMLACGIIHLLNSAQTNLEYYTQNILTINIKQKIYIYAFITCEFLYRLIFLSFFRRMIKGKGSVGYLIGEFIASFLLELYLSKREGQEKSFWIFSTILKGWTGAFYFRLEDTMVQDSDEWTSESRNLDNYRQQLRISNSFKSFRSKLFITFRFFENIFLTIVGIIQFSNENQVVGLFVIAIILLPFYCMWHFKYCRFNFNTEDTGSNNINDSAVQAAVQTAANKYKDDNPHKQMNSEQNQIQGTPEQNKYGQKDKYTQQMPSENTYQSEKKQRMMQDVVSTPPVIKKNNKRTPSSSNHSNSNYNQNIEVEEGQFKAEPLQQKVSDKKRQQIQQIQKLQEEQDYDNDDPYGQADVNAFAIE